MKGTGQTTRRGVCNRPAQSSVDVWGWSLAGLLACMAGSMAGRIDNRVFNSIEYME